VEESFVAEGVPRERLVRNPYGVSLEEFQPTPVAPTGSDVVLMTGTWSWRKGADVLVEAMAIVRRARPDVELLHVGSLAGDIPFPRTPGFRHVDAVAQSRLAHYYGSARVSVLPSREDGFGVVLAQALASGVPIVCSRRTGGSDLRELIGGGDAVTIVEPEDALALAHALEAVLDRPSEVGAARRDLLDDGARARISWRAYGRRWHEHLLARLR
jgi:glycosyltransferase involved in cell wall biosynthesis